MQSSSVDKEDNLSNSDKHSNKTNPIAMESFNSSNSSSSGCLQQQQTNKQLPNLASNFNRNSEHCYIHNEQLRNAVDKAVRELNQAKAEQQQICHPDEETISANEEEARKQFLQNERLAQQAQQNCTCNDNVEYDEENDSSSNAGENTDKNQVKKIKRSRKLFLNSKFFTPVRKTETIQQIQIRIHEFVNSMLTIKNIGNGNINNNLVNNLVHNNTGTPLTPTSRLPASTVGKSKYKSAFLCCCIM